MVWGSCRAQYTNFVACLLERDSIALLPRLLAFVEAANLPMIPPRWCRRFERRLNRGLLCLVDGLCHATWTLPTGRDIERRAERPSGIPPLATLFGLAIAQAVALLFVQYETGREVAYLSVFAFVAILVIGGMVGIMRAVVAEPVSPRIGEFNRSTVIWGTWTIYLASFGLATVLLIAALDQWPQKPSVNVVEIIDYKWKDKTDGKIIRGSLHTGPIHPIRELTVTASLTGEVAKHWRIEYVQGYLDPQCTISSGRIGPYEVAERTSATHHVGVWKNLTQPLYFFEVSLHQNGTMTTDELTKFLESDRDAIRLDYEE